MSGPDDPSRPGGDDARDAAGLGSSADLDAPERPAKPREPMQLTADLRQAILASDALTPQSSASGGEPLFRATGDLVLTGQTPHADGSTLLAVRATADVRPAPGAAGSPVTLELQVWIDAAGRVFDVRTLGTKDADTAELERLLDGLK